eukprot:8175038-Lingulodinium_polyedra.AAC.1
MAAARQSIATTSATPDRRLQGCWHQNPDREPHRKPGSLHTIANPNQSKLNETKQSQSQLR